MSAWMVTDAHVDLLATAYVALVDTTADPQKIGQEMLRANARSLVARYGHDDWTRAAEQQAESYTYRRWLGNMDPCLITTEMACFDYQSCEFEEWPQSQARRYLDALQWHCPKFEDVPEGPRGHSLYPWGIDCHPEDKTDPRLRDGSPREFEAA